MTKLRALQETYFEKPRSKGEVFEADYVNARILVEIIKCCEIAEDPPAMNTRAMKAEEPTPVETTTQPTENPTDNVTQIPKRKTYKRRDMQAEE